MPPLDVVLTAWRIDWAALALILSAALLYSLGLKSAKAQGHHWPRHRSVAFYLLGLGSFAALTCGFPGVYSADLRWAFTLKVSLLFFIVPLLVGLGRPVSLARAALSASHVTWLDAVLSHRLVRIVTNSLAAPLVGLALFSLFLTPAFHTLRTNPVAEAILTVLVPLLGLLMALPVIEEGNFHRSSAFITLELIFVFMELLIDAIPGILLRLNGQVLDNVMAVQSGATWYPSALRDQQLAGDLLWFICEIVDLPLIILMFMRLARSDRREAKGFDDLSDEQLDELNAHHLRRVR